MRALVERWKRIPRPVGAVLLGALTLVVTPLVSWTVAAPFLLVVHLKAGANPAEYVAKALHIQDLQSAIAAVVILAGFFWFLGNAGAAFVSWLIYRSRWLAVLTLVSGFGFQLTQTVWSLAMVMRSTDRELAISQRESAAMDSAFAEVDKLFTHYATLEPPQIFLRERHDDWGDDYPQFGPYFGQVEVGFPITVHRPGVYRFEVHYESMRESAYRFICDTEANRALSAGRDTLLVGFRPGMYRSPRFTGGKAWVKVHCVIPQREYLAMATPMMRNVSRERIRNMEESWAELDSLHPGSWDHFVDSSGTSIPRPAVLPKYVRPVRPSGRDDRGQPLSRQGRR